MRYEQVQGQAKAGSVRRRCSVLGVSVSGYYAWLSRSESRRQQEDRRLREQIREFHARSHQRYGSPRVHRELIDAGERVSRKRVARLMREAELVGRKRRRPKRSQTLEGWLYLAVLLDPGSRRVVGWAMSSQPSSALTESALRKALELRRPPHGLLHHSDRGCQYTATAYLATLETRGMKVSFSRRGNCWDNAPMESFFSSLKEELGDTFSSRARAHGAVFEYIEVFYNRRRLHSALGYLSPAEYERRLEAPAGSEPVNSSARAQRMRWAQGTRSPLHQQLPAETGGV